MASSHRRGWRLRRVRPTARRLLRLEGRLAALLSLGRAEAAPSGAQSVAMPWPVAAGGGPAGGRPGVGGGRRAMHCGFTTASGRRLLARRLGLEAGVGRRE